MWIVLYFFLFLGATADWIEDARAYEAAEAAKVASEDAEERNWQSVKALTVKIFLKIWNHCTSLHRLCALMRRL